MNVPWGQLAQLFIFALFVYAAIEVLKDLRSVLKRKATAGSWNRLLAVIVGYIFCWTFDFGVIVRIVEVGEKAGASASPLDYFGTSSLIAMGAAWVFDYVVKIQKQLQAAKAEAEKIINGGSQK